MLRYCMALPLYNEPKHSYVGPVVTEIIYFLPVQSSFEILQRKVSLAAGGGVHNPQPLSIKSRVLLRSASG